MRVGIATDPGGFGLKQVLIAQLQAVRHEVLDFGGDLFDPEADYPDYVIPLARAVASGRVERGIVICGSGIGAAACANKLSGVCAGLIHDRFSARQGVEENHMNVICLGERVVHPVIAWNLVQTFLVAEYSLADRHLRRMRKVDALELIATR